MWPSAVLEQITANRLVECSGSNFQKVRRKPQMCRRKGQCLKHVFWVYVQTGKLGHGYMITHVVFDHSVVSVSRPSNSI